MSEILTSRDDPRLTAYALGELSPSETAEIDRILLESSAHRATVDEIRELAGLLTTGLQSEPPLGLNAAQQAVIVRAAAEAGAVVVPTSASVTMPAAGRWAKFAASLATIAGMFVVALLAIPHRPTETGTASRSSSLRGIAQSAPLAMHRSQLSRQPSTPVAQPAGRTDSPGQWDESREATNFALGRKGVPSNNIPYVSRLRGERRDAGTSFAASDLQLKGVPARQDLSEIPNAPLEAKLPKTPAVGLPVQAGGAVAQRFIVDARKWNQSSRRQAKADHNVGTPVPADITLADTPVEGQFDDEYDSTHSGGRGTARLAANRVELELLRRQSGPSADNDSVSESYTPIAETPFVAPRTDPLSTFGIDVDTASYANVRRFLTNRQLPPRDAVRIEELVNYFRYDDPPPAEGRPVAIKVEVGRAPWYPENRLVRIGLKGREIPRDRRPTSNLVFLIDVSGSMQAENKLPLVKAGLSLLVEQMTETDRVAIVTYSDTATLRLESTAGDKRQSILNAIVGLQANGSTNGAAGIQLAYETAIRNFIEGGANRVILCTDGDFNVGVTDDDELIRLIQEKTRSKIFFSVFGFGMGNLKDGKLEKLADKGNGHYAYLDSQREARKVFVEELTGTLVTVAKDVKLQVEFNPTRVGAYRLIGYENRALATQDFEDDKKDAGDMGAGHTVTALYEIIPADKVPQPAADDKLRYQRHGLAREDNLDRELLSVRMRYKEPDAETSQIFEVAINDPFSIAGDSDQLKRHFEATARQKPSRDFEWSAAVAAFGMLLRDSPFRGQANFDLVLELAQAAEGDDPSGRRQEFIEMVRLAKSLYLGLEPAASGKAE